MAKAKKEKVNKYTSKVLREFSSGGIVYRKDSKGSILWLVVASASSPQFPDIVWRLPKGWIDDAERGIPGPMASGEVKADEKSLRFAAVREVSEEGGVLAKIVSKLGTEKYFYNHPIRGKILKFVTFYLMNYVGDLPGGFDEETSEIKWLPLEKARKQISFSSERSFLDKAAGVLSDNNKKNEASKQI